MAAENFTKFLSIFVFFQDVRDSVFDTVNPNNSFRYFRDNDKQVMAAAH